MSNLFFTEEHEWVSIDGNEVTVGISNHATEELGEIVYVELPDEGMDVTKGDEFGSVESVKTVSGIYSPVNGRVSQSNQAVVDSPELINQSPLEDGWLIKVTIEDHEFTDDLMSEDDYNRYLSSL